jgi:glycosyltransferase involved in cell wall biosynthesis
MREQRSLISVVMAVLNNAGTLERALNSVLRQELAARELIVMDGGSTDGSLEILRRHASAIAHLESAPDRGIYHAFNKALPRTRGDWIYILGADDYLWDAQAFSRMAPHLERAYPPARVVYAQANFVSARGEVLEVLGEPWDRKRPGRIHDSAPGSVPPLELRSRRMAPSTDSGTPAMTQGSCAS